MICVGCVSVHSPPRFGYGRSCPAVLYGAEAISADVLSIRADRDRYHHGTDTLFEHHPGIIKRLRVEALPGCPFR